MSSLKKLKDDIKKDEKKIENQGKIAEQPNETMLLAGLLKQLRSQHEVGLLTVCKQIRSIKIGDGVAEIDSDLDISELETNKVYQEKLKAFFGEYHLNIKLKEKKKPDNSAEILNEMLGGKLTIK